MHQVVDTDDDEPSPLEDEILVAMWKAEEPAVVWAAFGIDRQLKIARKEYVDEEDDLYRLKCLEAVTRLDDNEFIEETGDDVFRLTAKGLERVGECSKP